MKKWRGERGSRREGEDIEREKKVRERDAQRK